MVWKRNQKASSRSYCDTFNTVGRRRHWEPWGTPLACHIYRAIGNTMLYLRNWQLEIISWLPKRPICPPFSPNSLQIAIALSRKSSAFGYLPRDTNKDARFPKTNCLFCSQFSCKWVGLSSGILGPCYNCHQTTQTPRRSIKWYEECSVPVGCCLSISLASFYIDSECFLQVFLGLAIFAKRDEHCSEVHVGCCFPISVTNFYFDSESFLQVFSGLFVLLNDKITIIVNL